MVRLGEVACRRALEGPAGFSARGRGPGADVLAARVDRQHVARARPGFPGVISMRIKSVCESCHREKTVRSLLRRLHATTSDPSISRGSSPRT